MSEPRPSNQDDDEPELMRRARLRNTSARRPRSPMATLIIYAFTGGMIGFISVTGLLFTLTIVQHDRGDDLPLATKMASVLFGAVCWGLPAFILCGCAGAFVWAVSHPRK